MQIKTFFKVILFVFLFIGEGLSAQNISGGNSFNTATAVPTFDEMHRMSKDTNNKYLKFDLKQGEGVSIILTAHVNSGSMHMYAYASENLNNYIEHDTYIDDGETGVITFTAKTSGTYYLAVAGSAGLADIAVYQSFFTVGVSDGSRDFHSTFNTAYYLTAGNHARNSYGFSDYYRLEVQSGDEISIDLTAHSNSNSMNMYVYAPENLSYYIERDTYIGDGETGSVSFTAHTTGVYYIGVNGGSGNYDFVLNNGVRSNRDTDGDGLYNTVEYVRGTSIDKTDTNGNGVSDYQEAQNGKFGRYKTEWDRSDMNGVNNTISAKQSPYFNTLFLFEKDTNSKYLKFDLKQGEGVSIILTAHVNSGSMHMYAYASENLNNYIGHDTYIDDGETGVITFTAETSGTYYLAVAGSAGLADIAVYQSFDMEGICDSDRDFYSTFNTAYYLTAGNHERNSYGFSDYYRFEVQALDEISIDLTAHSNSNSMNMYVYAPENLSYYIEHDTYIGDGETGSVSFTAYTPGTYFLKITGARGNYDLSLHGVRANPNKCDKSLKMNPSILMYLLN